MTMSVCKFDVTMDISLTQRGLLLFNYFIILDGNNFHRQLKIGEPINLWQVTDELSHMILQILNTILVEDGKTDQTGASSCQLHFCHNVA